MLQLRIISLVVPELIPQSNQKLSAAYTFMAYLGYY
jgi:hypothetical protein